MDSNRIWAFAQNLPSIAFLLLWRLDFGLTVSGWAASVLVVCVWAGMLRFKKPVDPLLLGLNLNFVVATPVIHLTYLAGFSAVAEWMVTYVGVSVLLTVALTGLVFEAFHAKGFSGDGIRSNALVLIGLALLGSAWSFCFVGEQFLSVGLPLLVLFLVRRLLYLRPSSFMEAVVALWLLAQRRAQEILA